MQLMEQSVGQMLKAVEKTLEAVTVRELQTDYTLDRKFRSARLRSNEIGV